ncbi:hypothetical protein IBL25_26495, partial [Roseomonas ludipueritiae]|nr:hypothetical protein [Pseudoroseomonas ludipueritiae]
PGTPRGPRSLAEAPGGGGLWGGAPPPPLSASGVAPLSTARMKPFSFATGVAGLW